MKLKSYFLLSTLVLTTLSACTANGSFDSAAAVQVRELSQKPGLVSEDLTLIDGSAVNDFNEEKAIAMIMNAIAAGPEGKTADFPSKPGTKTITVPMGGPYGTKGKLDLKTEVQQSEGNYIVTLSKDWNVKVGEKEAKSYWKYEVTPNGHVTILKSENNDLLIGAIK